jgi:hypothetical protein
MANDLTEEELGELGRKHGAVRAPLWNECGWAEDAHAAFPALLSMARRAAKAEGELATLRARRFPELCGTGPRSVPWSMVEPFELQAQDNHQQSLQRLAERGGLSPAELMAVLRGEQWHKRQFLTDEDAAVELARLTKEHESERDTLRAELSEALATIESMKPVIDQLLTKSVHADAADLDVAYLRAELDRVTKERDAGLATLIRWGQFDGDHHKAWAIDQAVRELTGERYEATIADACAGEHGPETYGWDEGIPP